MATNIIRPNADVTNNWTKSTGTAGWSCIDDAVTQPTDASTSGDGASISGTTTNGTTQEIALDTFTLGSDVVSQATFWAFITTGSKGRTIDISLRSGSTQYGSTLSTSTGVTAQWVSGTYSGTISQTELDDLRLRFVTIGSGGGASSPIVYAAYVSVDHAVAAARRRFTTMV